jgi:hypothetical protein
VFFYKLILIVYLANGNTPTLTELGQFAAKQQCEDAANSASIINRSAADSSRIGWSFICVATPNR